MDKEWSQLNKMMQVQIGKKETFAMGIETLLHLRKELMKQILEFQDTLSKEELCAIPFINAKGYHSKTIAYSIYHVFRIEDIVAQTLIKKDEQVFFKGDYQRKLHSPIITTGNELIKEQIQDFSLQLDIDALYNYAKTVNEATAQLLQQLDYGDLKTKMTEEDKERLYALNVVSTDEAAIWLVDYWCGKNIKGLIQMPFSRHWIMHIEASLRIANKIH